MLFLLTCVFGLVQDDGSVQKHLLSAKQRADLKTRWEQVLQQNPSPQLAGSQAVQVHSLRGDAFLFLEQFDKAIAEYEAMTKIDPRLDVSHWRLGIAYFYADQFQKGADQFAKYHAYDNIDRENGIWRFLCQYKANGRQKAVSELLKYEKDDRKPFPAIYAMYQGKMSADNVLKTIPDSAPDFVKQRQLFYVELYIGMDLVVQNKLSAARSHLARSVSQKWAQESRGGANYMWHVARIQLNQIDKQLNNKPREDKK